MFVRFLCFIQEKFQIKETGRRYSILFIVFVLVIATIFIGSFVREETSRTYLTVAFLDVGQGDAIFIETPNGNQLLIDGGPTGAVVRHIAAVLPFYDRTIDMIMATHSDLDHIAGFPEILKRYHVKNYVTTERSDSSDLYVQIEKWTEFKRVNRIYVKTGDRIVLDEKENIYIDILSPDDATNAPNNNDASIVARLIYNQRSFLLMGDASSAVESTLISYLKNSNVSRDEIDNYLPVDVLKAGHHGSKYSSSKEFINTVRPEYAVISAGKDNKFGHPHGEVLAILQTNNTKILETSASSTIIFQTDGKSLWLR